MLSVARITVPCDRAHAAETWMAQEFLLHAMQRFPFWRTAPVVALERLEGHLLEAIAALRAQKSAVGALMPQLTSEREALGHSFEKRM